MRRRNGLGAKKWLCTFRIIFPPKTDNNAHFTLWDQPNMTNRFIGVLNIQRLYNVSAASAAQNYVQAIQWNGIYSLLPTELYSTCQLSKLYQYCIYWVKPAEVGKRGLEENSYHFPNASDYNHHYPGNYFRHLFVVVWPVHLIAANHARGHTDMMQTMTLTSHSWNTGKMTWMMRKPSIRPHKNTGTENNSSKTVCTNVMT